MARCASAFQLSACAALMSWAVLGLGCSSTATHAVKVDSLAKPSAPAAQSYRIRSKNPALGEESLRYREASQLVKTALGGRGLYEAPSDDKADIVVDLEFGMDRPRQRLTSVQVPVYGATGGGVRYDTIAVTGPNGQTAYQTIPVTEPLRPEVVGYEEVPREVTVFEKYVRLTARENKPTVEGQPPAEVWSVYASAEDESNDLRKYLPIMISAAADKIGQNTTAQEVVKVKEDSPAVDFIRRKGAEPTVTTVATSNKR